MKQVSWQKSVTQATPILGAAALSAIALLGVPESAKAVNLGSDYVLTPPGDTKFDFGFDEVDFEGIPLDPVNLGLADTVIERQMDIDLVDVDDPKTTPIEIVGLSLRSVEPATDTPFGDGINDVYVTLNPAQSSTGNMFITKTSENGGTWGSVFELNAKAFFRDGDETVGTIEINKEFESFNNPWTHQPNPDTVLVDEMTGWSFDPVKQWGFDPGMGVPVPLSRPAGAQTANCHSPGAPSCDQTEPLRDFFLSSDIALHETADGNTHGVTGKTIPEPSTILGSAMVLGFGALFKRQTSRRRKQLQKA